MVCSHQPGTDQGLRLIPLLHYPTLGTTEQKMIESLSAHGVEPMDLVPSLMATHTVPNPEYDPVEAVRIRAEKEREEIERREEEQEAAEDEARRAASEAKEAEAFGDLKRRESSLEEDADLAFGQEEEENVPPPPKYSQRQLPPEDDGGDIGGLGDEDPFADFTPTPTPSFNSTPAIPSVTISSDDHPTPSPVSDLPPLPSSPSHASPSRLGGPTSPLAASHTELETPTPHGPIVGTTTELDVPEEDVTPVLPGVSTSLTAADENITLDIRWTILCVVFRSHPADPAAVC